MAKKSRRARRRETAKATAKPVVAPVVERKESKASGPSRATGADFAAQYDYVYSDLKRIAILAGMMFTVLVVLSFLVR